MTASTAALAPEKSPALLGAELQSHAGVQPVEGYRLPALRPPAPGFSHDLSRVPAFAASPSRSRSAPALASAPRVQRKPAIGEPGDEYERQADQAAEMVMRTPAPEDDEEKPCARPGCSGTVRRQAAGSLGQEAMPGETAPAPAPSEEAPAPGPSESAPGTTPSEAPPEPGPGEAPPEPEVTPETTAAGLLADDDASDLSPGQMHKSEFLDALQGTICELANAELAGVGRSTAGCPYLAGWMAYYRSRSSGHVERALRRYVPEAADATDARDYIPLVGERVRQAVSFWAATGQVTGVPEGVSATPPEAGTGEGDKSRAPAPGVAGPARGGGLAFKAAPRAKSGPPGLGLIAEPGGGGSADSPEGVRARLDGGRPLDGGVRSRMESAFGLDFGPVRIHTGPRAAGIASRLNARALTVGSDVAFGAGEYRPGTLAGDALLAHELAHVAQQGGGGGPVEGGESGQGGYDALEDDADRSAAGAIVSLWCRARRGAARIARRAMPALRSGLRLQGCRNNPITSETVETQPADRSRSTIGVGEEVRLTHRSGSVTWSVSAGTLSATTGATVIWTAPDTAQKVTARGASDSKEFDVLAPTSVAMDPDPGAGVKHTLNKPDSGILAQVFLGPDTVNFHKARYRELNVPGVPTAGVYSCNTFSTGHCAGAVAGACPDKSLSSTVVSGKGTKSDLGDCAYSGHCGGSPPFTPGSITVTIPYEYKVGTGPFRAIRNVDQAHSLAPDGTTLTTSKAGATGTTTVPSPSVSIPTCP